MTDINNDEFFEDGLADASTNDNTAQVVAAFRELMAAEQAASELQALLENETNTIARAKTKTLPELLEQMGTEIWRDPESGITIELETAVNSSLPKDQDKRNSILDALRPIGIEQIMGEEFNLIFTPGDKRSKIMRELFGLSTPDFVIEDETNPEPELSPEVLEAIRNLRMAAGFDNEGLPATEKLGVHPSRLKSWLKDMIGKGHGTTIKEAGIWHGKHAKVIRPKGAK